MALEIITDDIKDSYKKITKIDSQEIAESYLNFYNNNYTNIVNFFSGSLSSLPELDFKVLDDLIDTINNAINQFRQNENLFQGYDAWILLENFENMISSLRTIQVYPRFLRTITTRSVYKRDIDLDYTLAQGQSLENVSSEVVGLDNGYEDWTGIAIDNDLEEEEYTSAGGINIKVKCFYNFHNVV